MSFPIPSVIVLHLGNEEAEVALISFWQSQQTLKAFSAKRELFCSWGGHSPISSCFCTVLTGRASHRAVFSAMPPSLWVNVALFRQHGDSFLFHLASITSFPFFPVVFIEHCGPIDHVRSLLIASALETSRFTHLHSPGCRLTWLARAGLHPPLCYFEFSHPCLPAFVFLVYFPDAGWISSTYVQVQLYLLALKQLG